jgi:hypothetical protein
MIPNVNAVVDRDMSSYYAVVPDLQLLSQGSTITDQGVMTDCDVAEYDGIRTQRTTISNRHSAS